MKYYIRYMIEDGTFPGELWINNKADIYNGPVVRSTLAEAVFRSECITYIRKWWDLIMIIQYDQIIIQVDKIKTYRLDIYNRSQYKNYNERMFNKSGLIDFFIWLVGLFLLSSFIFLTLKFKYDKKYYNNLDYKSLKQILLKINLINNIGPLK